MYQFVDKQAAIRAAEKEYDLEKGREEGVEIGEEKKAREIALNFLHLGLSLEQISEGTGLTIEVIKKLKESTNPQK